jgi:hypothetical protein
LQKEFHKMPPSNMNQVSGLGWKFFFALLMVLQVVATGVMWRTYDAVQETAKVGAKNSATLELLVIPSITRHDAQLEKLRGYRAAPAAKEPGES